MSDPSQGIPQEPGLEAALSLLRGLLTAGETLEAWAVQHRLFALTHRRACIAATSGRFITLNRRLFGGYDSADIRWQDLKETRISAGILAADLTLVAQSSSDLNIGSEVNRVWTFAGLRKDQAQGMYRICQQHDQVWREKRRIRELEELRAKSGGVQIGSQNAYAGADGVGGPATGTPAGATAGGESEPARRLRQAREMLDARLISDSEFESIKAKIVSGL
jgi:Bacterial PH domain